MKHNSQFAILLIITLISFTSCKKDDETPQTPGSVATTIDRVLVSCEGAFGQNNASVSIYYPDSSTVHNGVFEGVNGFGLGDVLQSMTAGGDKRYLVVNNSAKIEVTGTNLLAESPITGLNSPRHLVVSGSKGYVSNLFTDEVQIVDLNSGTISGAINIGGWSEEMLAIGDQLYCTRSNSNHVMVVDMSLDQVIDSIDVGINPSDILVDASGHLWTLGYVQDASWNITDAQLVNVDPDTEELLGSYEVPSPWNYTMALRSNGPGDMLYILNGAVYEMQTSAITINPTPLIAADPGNYGLGVDPASGDIYVGKAPDFTSNGEVQRFDDGGNFIQEFEVGIAPNGFLFE